MKVQILSEHAITSEFFVMTSLRHGKFILEGHIRHQWVTMEDHKEMHFLYKEACEEWHDIYLCKDDLIPTYREQRYIYQERGKGVQV